MKGTTNPNVKICCISSKEEAEMAIEAGASSIGLVGHMPSGPGIISDSLIASIAQSVPTSISTFLLTSEIEFDKIIQHHKRVNTTTIQIVDAIDEDGYAQIRNALPKIKLVQVVHVVDEKSVEEAVRVSSYVDTILLDSGNPTLKIKQLGGTGKAHNWDISKSIREKVDIPLYLAGGLNSDNVGRAIKHVQPFGVDLCSGVRTNGNLDPQKLTEFFDAISQASNF